MKIRQTTDKTEIKRVLCDPAIYYRLGEDGQPEPEGWQPPDNAIYLTDEKNTSVMIYHWVTSVCLEGHVQVLPEAREAAYDFGMAALDWAWKNTKAVKVVCQVPEIYPDVLKFVLKGGFVLEGFNQSSYLKNGDVIGQYNLGIRRPRVWAL